MHKLNFTWPNQAFKNFFAFWIATILLYIIYEKPDYKEIATIFLTLIIKHYFDSNTASAKKDDTINSMANSIPNAPKDETNNI